MGKSVAPMTGSFDPEQRRSHISLPDPALWVDDSLISYFIPCVMMCLACPANHQVKWPEQPSRSVIAYNTNKVNRYRDKILMEYRMNTRMGHLPPVTDSPWIHTE
jgi:hypothetical protein